MFTRERHEVGLRMKIRRQPADPQSEIEPLRVRVVADAAVDDDADPALALEVGEHHVAEDAALHVAARVDHDDIAGLRVIEDVAMQLLLRLGVFVLAVKILALRHELQRQRRTGDGAAGGARRRPADMRVADAHPVQRAARGRGADPPAERQPTRAAGA